jgi:plasmid replication initiation protein
MRTDPNNMLVVKSNQLINARYKLSKIEMHLILLSIGKWRENGEINKKVSITVDEFIFMYSDVEKNSAYAQLKSAAQNLYDKNISGEFVLDSGAIEIQKLRWVQKLSYIEGEGRVELTFSDDVIKHVGRQTRDFTNYQLKHITKIKSPNAIRIYELIKKDLNRSKTRKSKIDVNFLRHVLMLDGEYPRMTDFKKRVLEPAIDQINKGTDLNLRYSNIKAGKEITHFLFENNDSKIEPVEKKIEQTELIKKLMTHGMSAGVANKIKNSYPEKYLLETLKIVEKRILAADNAGKPIKALVPYLKAALVQDWIPVDSEFEIKMKIAAQKKTAKEEAAKENQAAEDAAKSADLRLKEQYAEAAYDKMISEQKKEIEENFLNFLREKNQKALIKAFTSNKLATKRVKTAFLQWLADWLSK